MDVLVEVRLSVEFMDDDLHDPAASDPMSDRMVKSAGQAVLNALVYTYHEMGFAHDLEDIMMIEIDNVSAMRVVKQPKKIPGIIITKEEKK